MKQRKQVRGATAFKLLRAQQLRAKAVREVASRQVVRSCLTSQTARSLRRERARLRAASLSSLRLCDISSASTRSGGSNLLCELLVQLERHASFASYTRMSMSECRICRINVLGMTNADCSFLYLIAFQLAISSTNCKCKFAYGDFQKLSGTKTTFDPQSL